jgi:hypothetical protein
MVSEMKLLKKNEIKSKSKMIIEEEKIGPNN